MKTKLTHKLTTAICALALLLSLASTAYAADEPVKSRNINAQNYSTYGTTVKSYLYENAAGGLTRVEYTNNQVVVEDYNSSLNLTNSRTISMELPIWGGFYAGSDANYLIFGQGNSEESKSTEVIRVVKYSKDWQRLDAYSLLGANTKTPFGFGSLRCTEYSGYLYIRNSHEMFKSSDGLNHQSCMTMVIKESDMSLSDAYYEVMNSSMGYVSHSFNQFILVDSSGHLTALDHGDAYPRSIVLCRYKANAGNGKLGSGYNWCEVKDIQALPGQIGDNTTGASAGGLEETTNGYVSAYNFDGTGGGGTRDIYLGYTQKNGLGTTTTKIGSNGTTPQLAASGLGGGYILWNGRDGGSVTDTLYYASYSDGGSVGQVKTATASLSDCRPISYDGKLVWYVTNNSAPVFYGLDEGGVTVLDGTSGGQPATETPTTPGFTDVPADAWYADAVKWAIDKGITNGTGNNTFSPDKTCNTAEILTFLWRASGSPKAGGTYKITDVSENDYFYEAAQWARSKGMISGSTLSPNTPCTRASTVMFIWQAMDKPSSGAAAGFSDVSAKADYASAVAWAVNNGVTNGTGDTTFSPNATCTRGQIVTFLNRAFAD